MSPGLSIAHYCITSKLGEGGMGEVWRATDTKLNRDVAIKILPDAFANDPDRMARFTREAQVLASLNHPNIAAIYGVEERALVMELVEGETLPRGLPPETALNYARQIAEALEYAHERGVVHRDLKPANIKVTPEGKVKVLDFGLAVVAQTSARAPMDPMSPTRTMGATLPGTILGTAAYMSPEQAAGKPVDRRSDIWSFGIVLWEMLTGARLFGGETISHTLADVLRAPIEFGKLPASTPASAVELVKRCLDRNVKTRLQAIGEARIAIQRHQEDPHPTASPPLGASLPKPQGGAWAVAVVLALAVAGLGYVAYRHSQEPLPKMLQAAVLPPERTRFVDNSPPALSPDGRKLAFAGVQEGKNLLWVRNLDSAAARSLTGSEGARDPFWSPDGQSIGFYADGKLKRTDLAGGTVQSLCATEGSAHGASWSSSGVILFSVSPTSGLYRVPAAGGTPVPVTQLDTAAGEVSHRFPWFLPDGRHFLFTVRNQDTSKHAVYAANLDSNQRIPVMKGEVHTVYVSAGGLLVYTSSNNSDSPLVAQGLDITSFRTRGDPVLIAESVTKSNGVWAQHLFSVSSEALAYASGGDFNAQLTWFDRTGKVLGTLGLPDPGLASAAISPDGSMVASESAQSGGRDIWLYDVARGPSSRFTLNAVGATAGGPAWSPDGKYLLFSQVEGGRSAGVVRKAIAGGGRAEPVGSPWGNVPRTVNLIRWSRDGQYVVAALGPAGGTGTDIWMASLSPPGQKARPYLENNAAENGPSLSPTSDWLAYASDETRRLEVYVNSFPNPGRQRQVSINGGSNPVWSRDGKEIFFIGPGREMMAVAVRKNGGGLEIGTPKVLFDSRMAANPNLGSFDVDKDGRFLIPVQQRAGPAPLNLIINWQAGLKK